MALTQSPSIVTNGLVMYYDMTNIQKSSTGAPTTNISTGTGIGTYLNTPSDVTSTLTQTGELYRGQPVYKQVLTPVTATGVSYLTNAGNPGIGTVTGGGGGAAARFTGHSIFFKPATGRSGLNSSTPIYTHYSNIGGWQSSANYDDMGDGWYRAHVIFYSAGGGSDGKYWAINPAGATLNVPLTVYWAAPFKEDRNDSTHVSPYVNDTRSNTQSILDLTGNNTVTANSLTYASDGTFSFNGTTDFIDTNNTFKFTQSGQFSAEVWLKILDHSDRPAAAAGIIGKGHYYDNQWDIWLYNNNAIYFETTGNPTRQGLVYLATPVLTLSTWHHYVATYNNGAKSVYLNGALVGTQTYVGPGDFSNNNNVLIGRRFGDASRSLRGSVSAAKIYNRALSAAEVQQNFNALRGRYGI